MKQLNVMFAFLVSLSAVAADKTWSPSGSQPYNIADPSNWGGALPTSADTAKFNVPSGDQAITGDLTTGTFDINNNTNKKREFDGNLTARNFVFRQGVLNIRGRLELTGSGDDDVYSRVGTSQSIPGSACQQAMHVYGSLLMPGQQFLCVARGNTDGGNANGFLQLHDGGELVLATNENAAAGNAGLALGRTSGSSNAAYLNAAFVQDGGHSTIGRVLAGFEARARGTVAMLGGVMEFPYFWSSRYRIGHSGFGHFQQLGGEVLVHTNNAAPGLGSAFQAMVFEIGSGQPNSIGSSFYAAGGSFTCGRDFVVQGNSTGSFDLTKKVSPVSATVDGSSNLDVYRLVVGGNATPGPAVVNLNGGILSTFLVTNTMSRKGWSCVNGNGGRLSIKSTVLERNQFMGVKAINVYEGGLSLDCQAGVVVGSGTTPVTLRTPKGFGVESIAYSGAQDYYYAPMVEISGGSGSNATAIALVDWGTHKITNIVVTCRGEGYGMNDELVVKFTKPNAQDALEIDENVLVAFSENKPGALVKTGSRQMVLNAQPEFDGAYEVREGRVLQSTGDVGSPLVSEIRVGGVNAEFQCASAGRLAAAEDRVNMVNTNVVLTLGTEFGPGSFTLPVGRDKDHPYVQRLSLLRVRGTGNAIRVVAQERGINRPVRLSIGSFDFAEGSQVLLPTDSEFRVYAPISLAGQFLKHVGFEGRPNKVGFVAPDGQIVPRGMTGLSIIIR